MRNRPSKSAKCLCAALPSCTVVDVPPRDRPAGRRHARPRAWTTVTSRNGTRADESAAASWCPSALARTTAKGQAPAPTPPCSVLLVATPPLLHGYVIPKANATTRRVRARRPDRRIGSDRPQLCPARARALGATELGARSIGRRDATTNPWSNRSRAPWGTVMEPIPDPR